MKTHRIFISGLLCGIFILSACQTESVPITPPPLTPAGQNATATQQKENQSSYSEFDMTAYNGAISLQDVTLCGKITNADLKIECSGQIEKQKIISEAKRKIDPAICEKLNMKEDIDTCKLQIDIAKKTSEQMRSPTNEEQELFKKAQDNLDTAICEKIEKKDYRDSCLIVVEELKVGKASS